MPFTKLGLYSSLARGAQALGYTEPTPIQIQAIPSILTGRDLVASAPTGTGKTAAFVLPVLNRLGPHQPSGPRVLVLAPTRELSVQVGNAFRELGRFTDLVTVVLHGGVDYNPQRKALRAGADIVVATVGRLSEFLDDKVLRLDRVSVLILDEVDRMLDMGFIDEVKTIVRQCPLERQTLLFSATVPPALEEVAKFALREPVRIEIGRTSAVTETVNHAIHTVAEVQKFDLLLALLQRPEFTSVLIFARTKHGADHLAHLLRLANRSVAVLHANRTQPQRVAALAGFKSGKHGIMVATDIAARGIDVAGVSHVINYDVPRNPEDYVHRIGRTGRALSVGDALMLVSPEEAGAVHAIEKFIGQKIAQRPLEGFAYKGGQPPVIDTSRPGSGQPPRAGRQRLGAGGQQKGETGRHQSRAASRPSHGGGNPNYHPKGKPGAHWRSRSGR
ncbi:MAG: DEAD/DEAH box helicase [Opitutae bacterium]|nr:DEAD/DEAH box helicase [Opitutae bacterium]